MTSGTESSAIRFEQLRRGAEKIDPADLDALWAELRTVHVEEILGEWKGSALDTGHRSVSFLRETQWYGKHFVSLLDAKPFIRFRADGTLYSDRESAGGGEASLWMIEYRGELTAAMVYDCIPVVDHFKKIDDTTLLGIMNGKDPDTILDNGHHLYFTLSRA